MTLKTEFSREPANKSSDIWDSLTISETHWQLDGNNKSIAKLSRALNFHTQHWMQEQRKRDFWYRSFGSDLDLSLISVEECKDKNKECSSWASKNECKKNAVWMAINCRKSCGICKSIINTGEVIKTKQIQTSQDLCSEVNTQWQSASFEI